MKTYNKEKRYLHLAIVATLLIFLYQLGKILNVDFVWQYDWTLKFLINNFFIVILIVSIVRYVKEQRAPLLIQVVGALVTFLFLVTLQQVTDTEKNFRIFKEDREEIIQLVLDNKIEKKQPQYSEMGFFSVPGHYLDGVAPYRDFQGQVHSEDMYFFFFPYDTQGFFSGIGPGTYEGFVYSSLNRPPTWQEFNAGGQLRHIEGHWYYLNSEEENFQKDCPTLCNN